MLVNSPGAFTGLCRASRDNSVLVHCQANLLPPWGVIERIGVGGESVTLDCLDIPGSAYAVWRATDVQFTANLTTLFTANAPSPSRQYGLHGPQCRWQRSILLSIGRAVGHLMQGGGFWLRPAHAHILSIHAAFL
jgi:hypothetical protein